MSDIGFYEVVGVPSNAAAAALGVAGTRGVVVGISGEDGEEKMYAVLIGDRTYMLGPADLVRTGESVDREAIYGGETISVSPERYPDNE